MALPAKLRASCQTSSVPALAVVQVPFVKGCSITTSRVRRVLSCIRSLYVAMTSRLQINHELRLANQNLTHLHHVMLRSLLSCAPRNVVVESRAYSSAQQPAHGQEPYYYSTKDTARADVSSQTNCETTRIQALSSAHTLCTLVLTLVTCGRSAHFQSQTAVLGNSIGRLKATRERGSTPQLKDRHASRKLKKFFGFWM